MIRNLRHAVKSFSDSKVTRVNQLNKSFLLSNNRACFNANFVRTKRDDSKSTLFKPVPIKQTQDDMNVGAEITGSVIDKAELLKILNKFSSKREIRMLCLEHGLDRKFLFKSRLDLDVYKYSFL